MNLPGNLGMSKGVYGCMPRRLYWMAAFCVASTVYAQALRLSAPKTTFYLGEAIPLTLAFTAETPRTFVADSRLQDRVGRLNGTDIFVVDPAGSTEDPLRGLPGEGSGMGGLSGGNAILTSDKPFRIERTLNEWVRFREPGTYRVHVQSHRVRRVTNPAGSDMDLQIGANSTPVEVVSNEVTLQILAPPPEWVSAQIGEAAAILDGTTGTDSASVRERQSAGLTLRFLDTVESAVALAKRLPDENSVDAFALHSGILDSHHRAELLPQLHELLAAPDQPISERFVSTLAQLAMLVESGGVMPPFPQGDVDRQAWQAEAQRRTERLNELRQQLIAEFAQSAGTKTGAAWARSLNGLLNIAQNMQPQPAWLTRVLGALVTNFRTLPGRMQRDLLESRWRWLRDTDMLPTLEALYSNPPKPDPGYPSIADLVLRRLYELNPARGRQLILEDLHRPEGPRNNQSVLLLPDETLPELDEVFRAQLARGGPPSSLLIARYATGNIVKQVEAAYAAHNAQVDHTCPFPLVFYFLKHDPTFGAQELRRGFANRCYDMGRGAEQLGASAMSPALEKLAIEHLTNPIVPIKRGAAEMLGKYGSPSAQQPLWETIEYFRAWWKDQEAELAKSGGAESHELERTLTTALGKSSAWTLDAAGLRRLLSLCSSRDCRSLVGDWLRAAGERPTQ